MPPGRLLGEVFLGMSYREEAPGQTQKNAEGIAGMAVDQKSEQVIH